MRNDCVYMADMSLDPTGTGRKQSTMRWKPALNAFQIDADADAGIQVVLNGIQMPRMNSIIVRRIQTCRHELLDRTQIWNQRHLLHTLREYEQFYNNHRPHQGIASVRPIQPLRVLITTSAQISQLGIHRRLRLGGILNEYHHAA
jgi:putative transposase